MSASRPPIYASCSKKFFLSISNFDEYEMVGSVALAEKPHFW
jgi:hypothetical protein